MDLLDLGVTLLLLGSVLGGLTFLWIRSLARQRVASNPGLPLDLPAPTDAVLLVLAGGQVAYANAAARELFNLGEEQPNLEILGRRARPSQAFFALCAGECLASFALDGRFVEGSSHALPYGEGRALLVSLRRPALADGHSGRRVEPAGTVGLSIGDTLSELSQAMTASIELESALRTILESIESLIPSDYSAINCWDPDQHRLESYHLVGGITGLDRRLDKTCHSLVSRQDQREVRFKPAARQPMTLEDFTGILLEQRQPLLVPETERSIDPRPAGGTGPGPFHSYLGVPLISGGSLLGTLELAAVAKETYGENDLEILRVLARPAAVALHNARQYEAEKQRARELTGLARLTQVINARNDPQGLYPQLVESIAPLLSVEAYGFLVFNQSRHVLEARTPFYGLPDRVVEWIRVPIEPGSRAEGILQSVEVITCDGAVSDPRLEILGLQPMVQAAGFRHMVLTPLAAGGRSLGYFQAADKRDGSPFTPEDLRLLMIIAGQAAPILANADLVLQLQRRALYADTLRCIAGLVHAPLSQDEILMKMLQELASLLNTGLRAIYRLDEARGELRLHRASAAGIGPAEITQWERLPEEMLRPPGGRISGPPAPYLNNQAAEGLTGLPTLSSLLAGLEIQSVLVVPLFARERSLGELLLGSPEPDYFSPEDVQTAATAAGSIAGALEGARLSGQTDDSLRQRVAQLTALASISRELNSTLDLERLLRRLLEESLRAAQADCGRILLFKEIPPGELALTSGVSTLPEILLQFGDPPTLALSPLEQLIFEKGETLLVHDYGNPHEACNAPLPAHPGVRSALAAPIRYQGRVAGLIHLHAETPRRFDSTTCEVVETMAVHAALALGNARRFVEQVRRNEALNRRVQTLARLLETTQSIQVDSSLETPLGHIAAAVQAATPFDAVLISVYEPHSGNLRRRSAAGLAMETLTELRAQPQPWTAVETLLQPEYRLGQVYFIPYEKSPLLPAELHTLTLLPFEDHTEPASDRWHPEDLLLIPLVSPGGAPLGLISVDNPRDGLRPDRLAIETLEIFGGQAALLIAGRQTMAGLQGQVARLEKDLGMAQSAAGAAQAQLSSLQEKDVQTTQALGSLEQHAARLQAGLDLALAIGAQMDRAGILLALAQGLLQWLDFDVVLTAEQGPAGHRLTGCFGACPPEVQPQALLGQFNPLGRCLEGAGILLAPNLDLASEWSASPLLNAVAARAFVGLPIPAGTGPAAAVLGVKFAPWVDFSADEPVFYQGLARLAAAALGSLQLRAECAARLSEATLLLDFNRQLSGLEPALIFDRLARHALQISPAGSASLVMMWDAQQGCLVPQAALSYRRPLRRMEITSRSGESLPGKVFESGAPVLLEQVDFTRDYQLSSENLLNYREATDNRLPVAALAAPIRRSASAPPLGVLVLENFGAGGAFSAETLSAVLSLTRQTALTLEHYHLYAAAEARARQLQSLTAVARSITASLRPAELVDSLLTHLESLLPYNTGTLWLRQGVQLVVRAARGFSDCEVRLGLTVAVEDSRLLNEMITTSQPIAVGNVRSDPRFPELVEPQYLSWLGAPLAASGEVIGVIALEKTEPDFYTPDHVQLITMFAAQAAVAFQNAQLYADSLDRTRELDRRSERLKLLNQFSTGISASLDAAQILEFTLNGLSQAIQCTAISALLFAPDGLAEVRAEAPQTSPSLPCSLPQVGVFERLRQTHGVFKTLSAGEEPDLAPLSDYLALFGTRSLLAIPLATGSELQGILLIHSRTAEAFDTDEIGLARTIANQAAIALQNARLYTETLSLSQELEGRVQERTAELAREHRRLEALLRIITELSASLELEQVLNRTLQVLNEVVDAQQIAVMVLRPGETHLRHIASVGYAPRTPDKDRISPFRCDQGLAGWILEHRQPVIISDLHTDPRWLMLPGTPAEHRSGIGVPLLVGSEALGVLLFFHREVNRFSEDQLDLIQAAAKQVAIAVNNSELYLLIRDQAVGLQGMLRQQQEETSRSQAMLEAVAEGLVITNAQRKVALFNASAEKILGLERSQVIDQSLEAFTGLFGRAGLTWMEKIQSWSQDPSPEQPDDHFETQVTMEDGRVVSVHLAPVWLRSARPEDGGFLGTVSAFRDITHLVEVDRLKSEFVATVSHELRTPLTSIKGYVELLLMGAGGSLSPGQVSFLEVVKNNTDRLGTLVGDLLDISRIEAGREALRLQPFYMDEIASGAADELLRRSQEEGRSTTIELEVEENLPPAYGDPERTQVIFENLLDNASRYSPESSPIRLSIRRAGHALQSEIQDRGIGIPAGQQERIFERFYRGENPYVLATPGTGLGLSIVKHLVEIQGGQIWVDSSGIPGQGSTFSFTLPVLPDFEEEL